MDQDTTATIEMIMEGTQPEILSDCTECKAHNCWECGLTEVENG
jgi:hypothetical protein